jgi:hypothetical protein
MQMCTFFKQLKNNRYRVDRSCLKAIGSSPKTVARDSTHQGVVLVTDTELGNSRERKRPNSRPTPERYIDQLRLG